MIQVARDIVPLGDFKTQASHLLRTLPDRGAPLIVTQNGRPAAVVLAPAMYDQLIARQALVTSIHKGLLDAAERRGLDDAAFDTFLAENFGASFEP